MKFRITSLVLLLICFSLGCASLSSGGRKVRFTGQVSPECEFLGSIDGSIWVNNGDNHLKNQAAEMGGNWVVVTDTRWEGAFTGSKPSSGDVYHCPEGMHNVRRADQTIDMNLNQNIKIKKESE